MDHDHDHDDDHVRRYDREHEDQEPIKRKDCKWWWNYDKRQRYLQSKWWEKLGFREHFFIVFRKPRLHKEGIGHTCQQRERTLKLMGGWSGGWGMIEGYRSVLGLGLMDIYLSYFFRLAYTERSERSCTIVQLQRCWKVTCLSVKKALIKCLYVVLSLVTYLSF